MIVYILVVLPVSKTRHHHFVYFWKTFLDRKISMNLFTFVLDFEIRYSIYRHVNKVIDYRKSVLRFHQKYFFYFQKWYIIHFYRKNVRKKIKQNHGNKLIVSITFFWQSLNECKFSATRWPLATLFSICWLLCKNILSICWEVKSES